MKHYRYMKRLNWKRGTWIQVITVIGTVIALIISLITYWNLYLNQGTIEIYMPDEVALNLNTSPSFQIYATFSNDGSPNTWRIIKNIKATGWIYRQDEPDEEIKFDWVNINRFVSLEDYVHNYKLPNETIPNDTTFYSLFENYKEPFSVSGEQTVSKLLEFKSSSKGFNFSKPFIFEVEMEATTMDNKIIPSTKISYYGSGLIAADIAKRPRHFRWISACYLTFNNTLCQLYS